MHEHTNCGCCGSDRITLSQPAYGAGYPMYVCAACTGITDPQFAPRPARA
jgi:hypothetical protein